MNTHKAFVVVDIPEPCKSRIQAIRDRLGSVTARLPVEITVAGSSGVGPIPEGTDINLIRREVDRVGSSMHPFTLEFAEVCQFPGTGVFFLRPKARRPFDLLHAALASSRIPFAGSQFEYNPHCTLRAGPQVEPIEAQRILAIPIPLGEMLLDSLTVYAIDGKTLAVSLLHRVNLQASEPTRSARDSS